jgi:hypothetical protein
MTEAVPLILVGVLVGFGILRAVLPRRVTVLRRPAGAFELRRPLSRRLFELSRLAFWTVLLMIFFVASWWADFVLGALVGGVAVVVLVWRAVDRIRRLAVVIDRSADEVRDGEQREGRASDVQVVILQRHRREPLALRFRENGQPERYWSIPVVDLATAAAVGREIADYLGVPLDETPQQ